MAPDKAADGARAATWKWLADHLRCTSCHSWPLEFTESACVCRACAATYPRIGRAVNLIDSSTASDYQLKSTDRVADHPFDENAMSIIEQTALTGGMVLDCGSGLKTIGFPHVIQMEIVHYPLVDVLAVNQRLPFVDNSFDAVFSLDVLEHVDEPFASAFEITRVLKPGGTLYIDLPFLQHEHGYPNHYFNATRKGLEQLFRGRLESIAHLVPRSGQPIEVAHSVLSAYRDGLPARQRERFLSMTIAELIRRPSPEWLDDPIVTHLHPEYRWILASTTQALFRKPRTGESSDVHQPIEVQSLPRFANPEPYVEEVAIPGVHPPESTYGRGKHIARTATSRAMSKLHRLLAKRTSRAESGE